MFLYFQVYLNLLGFTKNPVLFPHKVFRATEEQLPVISSSIASGEITQAIHLLKTAHKFLPSKLFLFFDLGLDYSDLNLVITGYAAYVIYLLVAGQISSTFLSCATSRKRLIISKVS